MRGHRTHVRPTAQYDGPFLTTGNRPYCICGWVDERSYLRRWEAEIHAEQHIYRHRTEEL